MTESGYKSISEKIEQPIAMKILNIIDEANDIKTFVLSRKGAILDDEEYLTKAFGKEKKFTAVPGQFVMLWLPRLNMKPFGISYMDKETFSVTVCKVGAFTEELFKKKKGDIVGIMGPYGNGFDMGARIKKAIAFLAEELATNGVKVKFIIGAKTEAMLLYRNRFKAKKNIEMFYATDDGSFGEKGFTTNILNKILEKDSEVDMIYTCGPEIMMKGVIDISDKYNISCQASLERYMKCGFGVCGQCCCDSSGVRVCKEGPAFSKEFIKQNISEFGKYKRDGTGKKR